MTRLTKTLAVAAILGGVMLALPSHVAAGNSSWCRPRNHQPKWTKTINNDNDTVVVDVDNDATVVSETTAVANTGGNKQSFNDDHNELKTGDAKAKAVSTNVVNTTTIVIDQD